MIIEITDSVMGNNILKQNLVVSKQIRACSIFNKACRTIQCFKCYQYGHTTVQCSYEEKCGHCAGSHVIQLNSCSKGFRVRCCLCHEAHKPWMKSCPKKQKELRRIQREVANISNRFPVKGILTTRATAYFESEQLNLMNISGPEESIPNCTNETGSKRAKSVRSKPVKISNNNTPDMSIRSYRIGRSRSPRKQLARKRRDESKLKDIYNDNVNRTILGKISNNRSLRSTQESQEC